MRLGESSVMTTMAPMHAHVHNQAMHVLKMIRFGVRVSYAQKCSPSHIGFPCSYASLLVPVPD
jgi:hypothetical protein